MLLQREKNSLISLRTSICTQTELLLTVGFSVGKTAASQTDLQLL